MLYFILKGLYAIHTHIHIHTHAHAHTHAHTYAHTHACIYTHIQTERQIDRERYDTHKHTHTQNNTQKVDDKWCCLLILNIFYIRVRLFNTHVTQSVTHCQEENKEFQYTL